MKSPPCPICSPSGETVTVVYFLTTLDGLDCRCATCGTEWHVDVPPFTPDKPTSGDSDEVSEP